VRKLYKFSHSVAQGGYLYAHKTVDGASIENKEGLRNALNAVRKRFELIDATIKVYGTIFFLFFMAKPKAVHAELIETIQNNIAPFGDWSDEYIYTGVYDLQEEYIREYLRKAGFDYDIG
jgi:hypothetical protein